MVRSIDRECKGFTWGVAAEKLRSVRMPGETPWTFWRDDGGLGSRSHPGDHGDRVRSRYRYGIRNTVHRNCCTKVQMQAQDVEIEASGELAAGVVGDTSGFRVGAGFTRPLVLHRRFPGGLDSRTARWKALYQAFFCLIRAFAADANRLKRGSSATAS